MPSSGVHLSFDGGWSDGDPGNGRLRFDSPALHKAKFLYVNAVDAQEAMLGALVPTWKEGGVLVVERPGAETNRVVAWIIGRVVHGGSYYKVPILMRSVVGGFAAHDQVALHHYPNLTDVEKLEVGSSVVPIPLKPGPPPLPVPLAPVAIPDRAIISRLDTVEQGIAALQNRLAGAEQRLLEAPMAPVADRIPSGAGQPVEIIEKGVMARLDEMEQAVSRAGAVLERLATEIDRQKADTLQVKSTVARLIEMARENAA